VPRAASRGTSRERTVFPAPAGDSDGGTTGTSGRVMLPSGFTMVFMKKLVALVDGGTSSVAAASPMVVAQCVLLSRWCS
jgi:hypothetical protein